MIKMLIAAMLAAAPAAAAGFTLNGLTAEGVSALAPATVPPAASPEPARRGFYASPSRPGAVPAAEVTREAGWQKVALTVSRGAGGLGYYGEGGGMKFALHSGQQTQGGLTFRADFPGGGISGVIKNGVVSDTQGNTIDLSRDYFEYPALLGGKRYTLLGNCAYDQGFIDTLQEAPYEKSGLALNRKVKEDGSVRITGAYDAARFTRADLALILAAYIVLE